LWRSLSIAQSSTQVLTINLSLFTYLWFSFIGLFVAIALMIYDQSEFDLRCEWGAQGVSQLASISDVVIIVDVLSFSTCVEIATNNGAIIFPYAYKDESVIDYAKSLQAELASHRQRWTTTGYSLSPKSLEQIPAGTRLVLPSPNGSFLTLHTGNTPTLAGCLRNCQAVAQFAQKYGDKIAVIPAGKELIEKGFEPDVELAAAFNISDCVPLLTNNAYVDSSYRVN
jgi:2-phosphosulfolactate phosphatase